MKASTVKSNIVNPNFNTIIFDLNGTITSSVSKNQKHINFRNHYIESKIGKVIGKNLPKATTQALEFYGLDANTYYQYRNNSIDWNMYHSFCQQTHNILFNLAKMGYNLVLYTDCFQSQINPTLAILQLENLFDLVVSKEQGYKKPSIEAYQFIANQFGVSNNELLMVANDWNQDLEPLYNIGGNTIWVKSEKYLINVMNIIIEQKIGKIAKKTTTFIH